MHERLKKFENLWMSVAFAESGEHDASTALLTCDAIDDEESSVACLIV